MDSFRKSEIRNTHKIFDAVLGSDISTVENLIKRDGKVLKEKNRRRLVTTSPCRDLSQPGLR